MRTRIGPKTLAMLFSASLAAGLVLGDARCLTAQPMTMPPPMSADDMEPSSSTRRSESASRRSQRGSQQVSFRLASIPKMFGDVFVPSGQLVLTGRDVQVNEPSTFVADLPFGGLRRSKISENDHILPDNRVFVMYNHYHNAIGLQQFAIDPAIPPIIQQSHVDQYTVGIERMFLDDMASVAVRVPFASSFDASFGLPAISMDGGNVGNAAIVSKALLYSEETLAIGAGVTVDLPTGSDFRITTPNGTATLQNSSIHLLPFFGFVALPTESTFVQFTNQFDFAANGNALTGDGTVGGERYTEQNLMYLDLSMGVWLFQDPDALRLRGLAAVTELHYTMAMQDSDVVPIEIFPDFETSLLGNSINRFDVLDLTGGLAAQVGLTDIRVAAVVPLRDSPERFFDAEFQVQVNRRY